MILAMPSDDVMLQELPCWEMEDADHGLTNIKCFSMIILQFCFVVIIKFQGRQLISASCQNTL